jgi:hypothetical protein
MQVTAKGPGAWSSNVSVQILNGSVANTFILSVLYLGVEVERYANLTSPQDAVTKTAGSAWVTVTDLASATTAPNNNPAVIGPVALSAGSDDRSSVVAATMVSALDRFGPQLGDGCVAIPGMGDATHVGLLAHAKANNRVALLVSARGSTSSQLATLAAGYDSEYGGLFGPWIQTRDAFGGIRAIPPDGYVAAVRARAHRDTGPWQAPAGDRSRSSIVVAVDQIFDSATVNALEDAKVSPIVPVAGGVRLYGWRSLSSDVANWRLLTGVDTINRIVVASKAELERLLFETIDSKGHLLARVEGALTGIVRPMADQGGLYEWIDADPNGGNPIQRDAGFSITTDPTREVASANMVKATVAVRVSPTGALIQLTVTKVGVTRRF